MALERSAHNDVPKALVGGGQTGAPVLREQAFNRVLVVTTAGDSIALPTGINGKSLTIANITANSTDCFPSLGDTINLLAADTALAIAGGKNAYFWCPFDGKWYCILSA